MKRTIVMSWRQGAASTNRVVGTCPFCNRVHDVKLQEIPSGIQCACMAVLLPRKAERVETSNRLTASEYAERIADADRVEERGQVDNATRRGRYVSIRKGLSSSTWFVGIAKDECDAEIVESVG